MSMQSRTRRRRSGWGKLGVAVLGAVVLPLYAAPAQEQGGAEPRPAAGQPSAAQEARARDPDRVPGASSDRFQHQRQAEARAEFDRLAANLRQRFEALLREGRLTEAKEETRRLREHVAALGRTAVPSPARAARATTNQATATKSLYGEADPLANLLTRRAAAAVEQVAKTLQEAGQAGEASDLRSALQGSTEAARLAAAKLHIEHLVTEGQPSTQDVGKVVAELARLRDYQARVQASGQPAAPAPEPAARAQIEALEKQVQALSERIERLSRLMAAQRRGR